jgi:hypothetical protein
VAWKKIDRKEAIEYPSSQEFVVLYSVLKRIHSVADEEEYRQEKSDIK